LDWALNCLQKKQEHLSFTLTGDSWYGSLGWLRSHKHVPCTLALSSTSNPHLYNIFTHNLERNEYRVFENNGVLICSYGGEKVMTTATTAFKLGKHKTNIKTSVRQPSNQLLKLEPRFSIEDVEKLKTLSIDALRSIANVYGESKGSTILLC
jgi:hypothetical protein